jgi:hypothetical protein
MQEKLLCSIQARVPRDIIESRILFTKHAKQSNSNAQQLNIKTNLSATMKFMKIISVTIKAVFKGKLSNTVYKCFAYNATP